MLKKAENRSLWAVSYRSNPAQPEVPLSRDHRERFFSTV
jgi:hypothetical protein